MADVNKIRSVCFVSHQGAGKTSLVEAILHNAGATTRLGNVTAGNTVSDYNADEIERKISISSSALNAKWKDHQIFLVDTPGFADFVGEVMGVVKAVDAAVIVINATTGIEVGTDKVWDIAKEAGLARVIFINKIDKENAEFYKILDDLKSQYGKSCIALQLPTATGPNYKGSVNLIDSGDLSALDAEGKEKAPKLKTELLDVISEADDKLLEKYLEGQELTPEEIKEGLRKGIAAGSIVPVLVGSATGNQSIKELLDVIVDYLPSPADIPARKGVDPKSKEEKEVKNDEGAPFSAYVFKSISDPYVGQLNIFRVFSGTLSSNTGFFNSTKSSKERIGQLYYMQGKEQISVPSVKAGDIAAVAKLKDTATGDTLCDEKEQVLFEAIKYPEAAISSSVKPHSKKDEEKIMGALTKVSASDPTFKFARDSQTKELIVSGMGDLHLEIMIERLRKQFNVGVDIGTPKVAYKETINGTAKVQGKFKRQSGGRGQYGDCWIEVEPLQRGGDFEFVDNIVGGAIPRNYIPSVEKGIKETMQAGVIAGYPVVDIKVTLYDGSFHPVDSSDMAFQIAGSMAFKKAQEQAKPILLEPIMDVEIYVPDEFMGQITGNLNSRRGRILGMEPQGKMQVVKATVPLAEMFKYASELRSMTQGRGNYTMRFSHYEEVPAKFAQTIIAQTKKKEEEVKK